MTTIFRIVFVFFLYLFIIAGLFAAEAHEFKVGALDIGHPWSRPTPKDANIAGGYLTITNKGKVADRLIGGASPAASQIEVHEMANVDGMTKTRPLANGLEIKPGKTIELKPGAYRILLLGLKEPLQLGQKVKGTLVFEKAGPVEIVYNIEENPEASNAPQAVALRYTSIIEVRLRMPGRVDHGGVYALLEPAGSAPPNIATSRAGDRAVSASRGFVIRSAPARRTDDETGRREDLKNAASSPSATAAIWTRHFSPGPMIRSSPNAGRHRQRAANRHRKKGGRQPRCCAHRFSGSDWHFLPARY